MDFKLSLRQLLQTLCPAPSDFILCWGGQDPPRIFRNFTAQQRFLCPLPGTPGTIPEHLPVPSALVPVQLRVAAAEDPPCVGIPKGSWTDPSSQFIPATGASLWHQGLSNCHPEPALPQFCFTKLCSPLLSQNRCWAFIPSVPLGREQTSEQESKAGRN